jgi:hypothetical protein
MLLGIEPIPPAGGPVLICIPDPLTAADTFGVAEPAAVPAGVAVWKWTWKGDIEVLTTLAAGAPCTCCHPLDTAAETCCFCCCC